ncbi:MAG: hypothetical protein IJP46_03095 [Prevotella sp.]|nr:hypothetical protein [Prevotella sp.]
MVTKKNNFSPPPATGQGLRQRGQHSRWLWLQLMMFVLLIGNSQMVKGADAWEWPKFSAVDTKVVPSANDPTIDTKNHIDPWMAFEVSYLNFDGNNFYWENLDLYVDGDFVGSLGDIPGLNINNASDDPFNWNEKSGWLGNYFIRVNGFWQGAGKWKYMTVNVLIPDSYYGQEHTVSIAGTWVDKNRNKRYITPNQLKITSSAVSFPAPSNSGAFARTAPYEVTWTPSGSVTPTSGYGHQYLFMPNGVGSWITNSNPNNSYVLTNTSNANEVGFTTQYETYKTVTLGGRTQRITFYRRWQNTESANIVKACAKPTELTAISDSWDKTITLNWKKDNTNKLTNGKFFIFRYENGDQASREMIGSVNYDAPLTFTDRNREYNKQYTYEVSFILNNWDNDAPVADLTATKDVMLTRMFNFSDLAVTPKENSVLLSWGYDTPSNGQQLTFKVWRVLNRNSLKTNGVVDKNKVIAALGNEPLKTVQASQGTTMTCEDNTLANNMTLYLYVISVEAQETVFYSDVIGPTTLAGHTEILSTTANRGTYSNVVKVQWDVKHVGVEGTRYEVSRRLLGQENEEDYKRVYVVTGTESSYFFTDSEVAPGQFYQYRVTAQGKFQDPDTGDITYEEMSSGEADGFCQSRGTISGRVTYGTGTAVSDAYVLLRKNNEEGDAVNQFYSMRIRPQGGIKWTPTESAGRALFQGKAFTFQMYVRPEAVTANGSMLVDAGAFALLLKPASTQGQSELFLQVGSGEAQATGITLQNGTFTNLSVSNNGSTGWTFRTIVADDMRAEAIHASQSLSAAAINWTGSEVVFGCDLSTTIEHSFTGYMDDIRLWSKALTDEELLGNYDRLLIGTENGLKLYWPMDEGLDGLPYAYDYSKTSGVANENHGKKQRNTSFDTITPSDIQLRLYGKTDTEGNYVVRGIPFTGEGTSYTVSPTLGEHEFSPKHQTRFVNSEALTHNGVDFTDVSSFDVDGVVYYDGTTIPVKDVLIYVDGTLASKDGEAIKTDAQGKFVVSVPIGDHFIQVKKNGHTFVNGGRYPDDPEGVGTRFTFESEVRNLGFYDNTRVTVAGRVAGGDIETEKLLGLGLSKANIGQARLTLTYGGNETSYINAVKTVNGAAVSYNQSDSQRDFDSSTPRVSSTAFVAGGQNKVTILTDPKTGEWAAELLPLRYTVESVVIPAAEADYTFSNLPDVDASNPLSTMSDSLSVDSVFKYVASAKIEYKSQMTIDLMERADGSFGEKVIKVKGLDGNEVEVPLYVQDDEGLAVLAGGKVQYAFARNDETPNGCPVYKEMGLYAYKLHAYERYVNKDGGTAERNWVVDEVPLAGKLVKIDNQYATGVSVSLEDGSVVEANEKEFELDDDGCLTYEFQAGLPNFQVPYTRGISISLDDNGTAVPWEGNGTFRAVVLGAVSTGNNFTTQAPDQVLMVLRDPPGSHSSATYTKGHTFSEEGTLNVMLELTTSAVQTVATAVKVKIASGVGVATITETNAAREYAAGFEFSSTTGTENSWVHTTTWNTDISTSDDPDWVGAPADRFIGVSKNIIFGTCHQVKIKKNEVTGQYELTMEDGYSSGESFGTYFIYTQHSIENVVIPNFITLRNGLLKTVADLNSVAQPGPGEDPKYITTLQPDDPKFGTSNNDKSVWGNQAVSAREAFDNNYVYRGPSYWILMPTDWKSRESLACYQDEVNFYNQQIAGWRNELAKNEEAKVTAIQQRTDYLIENYSIDGGGAMTYSETTIDTDAHSFVFTEQLEVMISDQTKMDVDGCGLTVNVEAKTNEKAETSYVNTDEDSTGFSFTLSEDGDDDYLSVDVFHAPDKYSPVFVTRGGATSCPYEDAAVTKYYRPGTEISAKTVQIEKPEIEARVTQLTGIPAGGVGTFQVYIRNNSDTSEDGMYNLNVVPASNPDGLVVKMDGLNITTGRAIMVKAGEPMVKTFTVEQSNPDVLTYEGIKIRISSQCQKDNTGVYPEIADTTTIDVYFQPACSDIHLASSHSLVNTDTETMQTLSISGYNYTMTSLTGIRLQYKGENDADFHTLQEYVKDEGRLASDPNLLPLPALKGTEKLNYVIDLRDLDGDKGFTDKTYVFRAVTVCMQGGVEVNNESEEVTILRDMTRPQLIATPSPSNGILNNGGDMIITFNEDIQGGVLSKPNNFDVVGVLNESEVAHDVALSLTGSQPAKTDAAIDLTGKSFTASMWVNYQTDGTLLTHGTADSKFIVVIEGGKLAVSVNGQKAVSAVALPQNKWLYLNVAYQASDDGSTPTVSAAYALDAATVTLLNSVATNAYEGSGALCIGGNELTAKVQELSLWNSYRSMTEAQADMYVTKSRYTSGLIGYWQLNEGRGSMATDKARNRHITLPNENAWWINGANFALTLDGTKAAAVNIGALNTTSSEDYLIEAWFKADEEQNGVVSVLGTQKMDLRLNSEGKMELEALGSTYAIGNSDLRDGLWHHVALNVLKSTSGSGTIYLDGQQYKQIAASAMPALYGDKLMLGSHKIEGTTHYDQMLKGAIDEVRIWKSRRTANVITNNMYVRVKPDEAGLVAYYPMEINEVDIVTNQITATGYMGDAVTAESSSPAVLAFYNTTGETITPQNSILKSDNTAALKQSPKMENVDFDFVASERQIKVNLTMKPASKIEGCNIYITAKNVKDVNGNRAADITWGVYVQQNCLNWQESEVSVTKSEGERATFTTTIENRGSENEVWSLSGLPSWLTANVESGSLKPLSTGTLTFTVAESLPTGKYEETIYLTGSQNIAEPLTLSVKVKGEEPLWTVNEGDYEETMNLIGTLKILDAISQDEDDIVAAFVGSECRGVAKLEYKPRYDGYFVTMDIYGHSGEVAPLEFKVFDASTATIYPVVTTTITDPVTHERVTGPINFTSNEFYGTYKVPVEFNATDEIEQNIELAKGWNWISFSVKPDNMSPDFTFANAEGRATTLRSSSKKTEFDETAGLWFGSLRTLNNKEMYLVQTTEAFTLNVTGHRVSPADEPITIKPNWNWVGYNGQQIINLNDALASLNPMDGDVIKGQRGVAYYDEYEWIGSLSTLTPGKGYRLKSTATANRTLTYPASAAAVAAPSLAPWFDDETAMTSVFHPIDYRNYEDNMVIIAQVVNNGMPMPGVELGVFAGDECREAAVTDVNGMVYITVPGDEATTLNFRVSDQECILGFSATVTFDSEDIIGTPKLPFVLDMSQTTGIEYIMADGEETVYDLQGRRLKDSGNLRRGVYIINGKKKVK